MKDLFSQIELAHPLFFLLFLSLPLLWLRWRERSLTLILWRSLVFSLLVLGLANPQRVTEVTREIGRIFAFDLSRSIPPEMRLWMANQPNGPTQGDRTFVFGGEVKEVTDWKQWIEGEISDGSIKPERTNLENLFATLLRQTSTPQTVFLFTDGWDTQGEVERLLPSLASSGMRIFPLLPSQRPAVPNVTVKRAIAPHQGTSGENINLKVLVENQGTAEARGRMVLKRGAETLKDEEVAIKPGSQIFAYSATLPAEPLVSFQASFIPRSPKTDVFPEDNQATAWVSVQLKERVLVLNGRRGEGRYLEEILKRRGFDVTSLTVSGAPPPPSGYGAVIFNNVEREKFTLDYLAAVERHVAAGKAFLMLGAEGSFGPGGYGQTPVETVLPVQLKEPRQEEKNRAVVLIIDKSGSMREENKLLYAQEAAKAVARQLKDRDLLGVVGFDVSPFTVVPLSPLEGSRQTAAAQIDRLKPGGKTYLYPAIVEAKRQLERLEAGRKHVIILSDGETGGSGGDYIDLVSVMKDELKIGISAVAIGDQANVPLMKRIAQYGGGLFHHTYDPATLPQIVLEQIKEKPEEEPLVEKDFLPVPVAGSELLALMAGRSLPPIKGYVETELKRGARQDVIVPRERRRPPLLASWTYGKGRSAAFTTDLHGRWSTNWIAWRGLDDFWTSVFAWLMPSKESLPPHEIRINPLRNRPVLDLYLYSDGSAASNLRYSYKGKGGAGEGTLKRLAPGHYQTELPFSAPGDYRLEIVEERGGKTIAYPALGYTQAFDPRTEIPRADFNLSLLEHLAQITGGEINPQEQHKLSGQEVLQTSKTLRSLPIGAALVLFMMEILLRRFVLRQDL